MKKLNVTLLLLLSLHAPAFAQYANQPKNQWQQYFEQIADYDDIEDNNMEDMYERLCELEASPINLNTATADDLKQLSFLNSTQIEELTEYLDRYRPLQSRTCCHSKHSVLREKGRPQRLPGISIQTLDALHIQVWKVCTSGYNGCARCRRAFLRQRQQYGLRPLCLLCHCSKTWMSEDTRTRTIQGSTWYGAYYEYRFCTWQNYIACVLISHQQHIT